MKLRIGVTYTTSPHTSTIRSDLDAIPRRYVQIARPPFEGTAPACIKPPVITCCLIIATATAKTVSHDEAGDTYALEAKSTLTQDFDTGSSYGTENGVEYCERAHKMYIAHLRSHDVEQRLLLIGQVGGDGKS